MRGLTGMLSVVTVGMLATGTAAQERADFSGAWTSPPLPASRGGPDYLPAALPGTGWGSEFTIIQAGDQLVVERIFYSRGDLQPVLKFRYALDGTETVNGFWMGRGVQEQVSRVEWEGDNLVITTVHGFVNPEDGRTETQEVRQVLTLRWSTRSPAYEPSLVLETTASGVLGGPPTSVRTVYTKR